MDGGPRPLPKRRDGLKRSSILADPRHRRILSILRSRSKPTTVDELGRRLATTDRDDAETVTERALASIRIDLRHRCLPNLEAVGWIDRQPEGIRVDEARFVETVGLSPPELTASSDRAWNVVSALLARPYRRDVLSVVATHDDRLSVTDLAVELQERQATRTDGDEPLTLALHHVDLPKLAATGVIEYDPGRKSVRRTDRLSTCLDQLGIEAG